MAADDRAAAIRIAGAADDEAAAALLHAHVTEANLRPQPGERS
jgi:hypothetical protein